MCNNYLYKFFIHKFLSFLCSIFTLNSDKLLTVFFSLSCVFLSPFYSFIWIPLFKIKKISKIEVFCKSRESSLRTNY